MKHLYSESIALSLTKLQKKVRSILQKEMGLSVRGKRFYVGEYSYPITILLFEGERTLGYFDPNYYEIGIHKRALLSPTLDDILRHELAHYITWIEYGPVADHGKEFRAVCKRYGWGKSVYISASPLEPEKEPDSLILQKVAKLLSLATSSNEHEATLATIKAQKLMQKHNLTADTVDSDMVANRVLFSKRTSSKLQAIATILRTFFVYPVMCPGKRGVCLELFGERENVEIASYVADFLSRKLDELWEASNLSGLATKNSFFRGVASGYTAQVQQKPSAALVKTESHLMHMLPLAYPHLRTTKTRFRHCEKGDALGKQEGNKLTINKGVGSKQTTPLQLT